MLLGAQTRPDMQQCTPLLSERLESLSHTDLSRSSIVGKRTVNRIVSDRLSRKTALVAYSLVLDD